MAEVLAAAASFPVVEGGAKPALRAARVDSVMNDQVPRVDDAFGTKGEAGVVTAGGGGEVKTQANVTDDGVRVLRLDEWKEAALSLAEAFRHDDVSRYFLDTKDRLHWTEEQKWDLHVKIMEYVTYAHLLKGLVVCAGPNYDCVGLWMPPGKNMDDLLTIARSGMWRLNYQLSAQGKERFFNEFLPLLHDTKLQVMAERDDTSWYLVYIGTRPEGRGKGYARKVIEYVTSRADVEGEACYLESSHPVNRKIYSKLGFQMKKNIYLQRAEKHVELDIMVREPVGKH